MTKRLHKFWYFVESPENIEIPVEIQAEILFSEDKVPLAGNILNWKPGKGYKDYSDYLDEYFSDDENKKNAVNYLIDIELF